MFEEGKEVEFWKRVGVFVNKKSKVKDSKAETRKEIMEVLQKSSLFNQVTDAVAASVVEDLAQIPNLDLNETAEVLDAAKKAITVFQEAAGQTPVVLVMWKMMKLFLTMESPMTRKVRW